MGKSTAQTKPNDFVTFRFYDNVLEVHQVSQEEWRKVPSPFSSRFPSLLLTKRQNNRQ